MMKFFLCNNLSHIRLKKPLVTTSQRYKIITNWLADNKTLVLHSRQSINTAVILLSTVQIHILRSYLKA